MTTAPSRYRTPHREALVVPSRPRRARPVDRLHRHVARRRPDALLATGAIVSTLFVLAVPAAHAQPTAEAVRSFLEEGVLEWRYRVGGQDILQIGPAEFLPDGGILVPDREGYAVRDPDLQWELRRETDAVYLVLGDPYDPAHGMAWRIRSFDGTRIDAVLALPGEESVGLRITGVPFPPEADIGRSDLLAGRWNVSAGEAETARVAHALGTRLLLGEDGVLEARVGGERSLGRWLLSRGRWRTPPTAGDPSPEPARILVLLPEAGPAAVYAVVSLEAGAVVLRGRGEDGAGVMIRLTR